MLGTVEALSAKIAGTVVGDGAVAISEISAVGEATPQSLTFATSEKYFEEALRGKAAAILVDRALVDAKRSYAKPLVLVESTRLALATLLASLRTPRPKGPFRHPSAVIEESARIAGDAYVGAQAYVGANARIGSGTAIDVGAYVGAEATIGSDTWLHPHARVMESCIVGDRVVLHAGSVIGSEGFGWAFAGDKLQRISQIGNVVLADDVEIGANTCVDRAQTGSTRIGAGTKIDNLCQIGHNCRIGKHSVFAALTGLAGTTIIGDGVKVGGQAGFGGHLTVGSEVSVAGRSQVWKDVPDGATVGGAPARDHREYLRQEVMVRNLPKLVARVEALERERSPKTR